MRRAMPFPPKMTVDAPKSAAELVTLATLSPLVIGSRLGQFWFALATVPTAKDKSEATRMVTEKLAATAEATVAMQTAFARAAGDAFLAALSGRGPANAMDAIMAAGLRPYSRRVKANQRRLSK
ncbi:hypothetical protein [Jiella sonneratiae]|uniref:Antifreeze protein n=1 Tax=Jiella sonneratiae TaxID=2816856 RepID=A0ABS3J3D6_9HYPH|nr:hypothetical protein [Jiella sonneratiae]MBO0904186.1 hypothetical protein [Jiella sonneratiae]